MIDEPTAEIIATALYNQDITELDAQQLDELGFLRYADDPDVEFDELGLSLDAGSDGHGVNTEEEMLWTVDGYGGEG